MCPLSFGAWVYNRSQVNLTFAAIPVDHNATVEASEWRMLGMAHREDSYTSRGEGDIPVLRYYVVLVRNPSPMVFGVVFPFTLLLFMSLLSVCLTPESGEKMGMAITLVVAILFYLIYLTENIAVDSRGVPAISKHLSHQGDFMSNVMSVNTNLHTWLLIGWLLVTTSYQPTRSRVRKCKSLFASTHFHHTEFSQQYMRLDNNFHLR